MPSCERTRGALSQDDHATLQAAVDTLARLACEPTDPAPN